MNMMIQPELSVAERFAGEILQSFKMAWEGQRLHEEAYREANKIEGPYDDTNPVWDRMDAAEKMQEAADDLTNETEARAIAAGVDLDDLLYLVDQHLYGPRN
jgi:chromosome condensin MukBEF ATPase and DNA-binding subunit MukB